MHFGEYVGWDILYFCVLMKKIGVLMGSISCLLLVLTNTDIDSFFRIIVGVVTGGIYVYQFVKWVVEWYKVRNVDSN